MASNRKLISAPPPKSLRPAHDLGHDFDAVYGSCARDVARCAARLAGPGVEPALVVEEVFTIAHRRLDSLKLDVMPSTWLFGITRRVARAQRRKLRLWRLLSGDSTDTVAELELTGPTPLERLERHRALRDAYRALDRLREKYRTAFVLFELEGRSTLEIAQLFGTRVSTVKVWLRRARAQFVAQGERLATGRPGRVGEVRDPRRLLERPHAAAEASPVDRAAGLLRALPPLTVLDSMALRRIKVRVQRGTGQRRGKRALQWALVTAVLFGFSCGGYAAGRLWNALGGHSRPVVFGVSTAQALGR